MTPSTSPSVSPSHRRPGSGLPSAAGVGSLLFHALLVFLLLIQSTSRGEPKPRLQRVILIALVPEKEKGLTQPAQVDAAPPPMPVPVPQPLPKPVPPTVVPIKPNPITPAPAKIVHPAAPPKPAIPPAAAPPKPSAPATPAPAPVQKQGDNGDSTLSVMLARVRTNWLRPKASTQPFHCRFRIDYLAGGIIANVVMLQGCGDDELNDSVQRAMYKTQPLPLAAGHSGAGNLVLEFTP